jgi:hypothetical protein
MVYINTTGKHNEVWLDKPYATITVECPDCPSTEDAYNSGWTDGSEDGYHKGYQSGRTDGYDDGWGPGYDSGYTDAWQPAYDSGYTDGQSDCSGETIHNQTKFLNIGQGSRDELKVQYLGGGYMLQNYSEYIRPDSGYTGLEQVGLYLYIWPQEAIQDGFDQGYSSGYTAGLNACSGGSCEGVWEDRYNSGFTDGVNSVECSGYTQEDLDAAFASGYSAGLRDCSGYTPETEYFTIETLSAGSISWIKSAAAFSSKTIDYRVNGGNWSSITSDISSSASTIAVQAGDIVEFRGDNDSYGNDTGNTEFGASVPFNVKGNIMSLFDSTDFENLNDFPATTTNNLRGLFASSQVIDASNLLLPATALTESCYAAMFSNCIYLTAAPELPATALAVACYESMFDSCRNLATVPSILPATTLKDNCYHDMFQGCRSLVTAPELPATTLRVQSYQNMFRDCASLNYIKCLATDLSTNSSTSYWVQNVSSSGTFIKHASMSSWTTGDSGIPSNWNVQDAV